MFRILLPVDGSAASTRAVAHLIKGHAMYGELELHVLNVQPSLPGTVSSHLTKSQMGKFHQEEGDLQLAAARKLLDEAKVPYVAHMAVGEPAAQIAGYVTAKRIDQVVMGTRGQSALAGALLGSVASKVVNLCSVPVLLVK